MRNGEEKTGKQIRFKVKELWAFSFLGVEQLEVGEDRTFLFNFKREIDDDPKNGNYCVYYAAEKAGIQSTWLRDENPNYRL